MMGVEVEVLSGEGFRYTDDLNPCSVRVINTYKKDNLFVLFFHNTVILSIVQRIHGILQRNGIRIYISKAINGD